MKTRLIARLAAIACSLASAPVMAQEASLKVADSYFERQDYHTAGKMYEQILEANPQSGIAMLKAGISYLFTSQPEKGLEAIRKSRQMPLEMSQEYYYWLGRAFHLNMRIDSALVNYRRYLTTAGPRDEYRPGVERLIAQAHRTESYFVNSDGSPFTAENLGSSINSPFTERGPIISQDGKLLIFTSRRPLFPDEKPAPDGEYSEKTFIAVSGADGGFDKATPLFQPEDRKSWYRALQLLDGENRLLLYRSGKDGGLFVAEREGDGFKMPTRFAEDLKVNLDDADIAFSPDLKRAVISRTNLGADNAQLYIAEKKANGSWGGFKKFTVANTSEDEIAPSFSEDGKVLLFASKGGSNLGGYDLYRVRWNESSRCWSTPENLGLPINSPGNDINYSESAAQTRVGYISSARAKGLGEADIYRITYSLPQAGK